MTAKTWPCQIMNAFNLTFFCICTGLLFVCNSIESFGQIKQPVSWQAEASIQSGEEALLTFTAFIDEPWHLYSVNMQEGGPMPTRFRFSESADYSLEGNIKEVYKPVESFDPTFLMPVAWFEKKAVFTQRIKLKAPAATINATVEFMVCTDEECLLPETKTFQIQVFKKSERNQKTGSIDHGTQISLPHAGKPNKKEIEAPAVAIADRKERIEQVHASVSHDDSQDPTSQPVNRSNGSEISQSQSSDHNSLWTLFIAGFLGGMAALLMPCIFPLIPLTVGLFAKQQKTNRIRQSVIFGLSVISIYVGVGLLITWIFGSNALNDLATNGIVNMALFLMLLVFGASLMGAFEINLPSSWINKVDAQADKAGHLRIFFMAASLALVSFSCTGPIVGTLLVEATTTGNYHGPAIGMLGFAIALALPFMLFSLFPAYLRKLPKSGTWMNTLKVSLGFLELALCLKFLSNVDLAYHWNWLSRDVFLVLWISIFACMGLFLLGKIKLPSDRTDRSVPVLQVLLAMPILAFTLYMIPGLWGAPLKTISAFLPPAHTQDFNLTAQTSLVAKQNDLPNHLVRQSRRYAHLFHAPPGLDVFFDYQEGLAYARRMDKPVLVDFTGHACVNCRKMETNVWTKAEIHALLRDWFVVIQLYVDDKTELPLHEQYTSQASGRKIQTIGQKWSELQALQFNSNAQPLYVLLNQKEELLVPPKGADYNADSFKQYLDEGIRNFYPTTN
jgi:thiol:disulfide interchange protein DsbD